MEVQRKHQRPVCWSCPHWCHLPRCTRFQKVAFSTCKQGTFWVMMFLALMPKAKNTIQSSVVFFPFFISFFLCSLGKANSHGTLIGWSHIYWLCRDLKGGLISCNGQSWDLARTDFVWGPTFVSGLSWTSEMWDRRGLGNHVYNVATILCNT